MSTTTTSLAPWQWAWRQGVAPQLSTAGLKALQKALERDDPALIQGQNMLPPPLQSYECNEVTAACAICLAAWKGDYPGCASVAKVDSRFVEVCYQAGQLLKEPAAIRFFLTHYDSWTREEMRQNLLPEVGLVLAGRDESTPWDRNVYPEKLTTVIETEDAGQENPAPPVHEHAQILNLMDANAQEKEPASSKPLKKMAPSRGEESRARQKKTS